MKFGKSVSLAGLLLLSAQPLFAQVQGPGPSPTPALAATAVQIPSDADLQPLVKYLSNYKYEMKQSRLVFHWFQNTDAFIQSKFGNVFTGNLSATDPIGLQYVQGMSKRYFNYQDASDPGSGNMYGPGLYAAVDPVATRSYGGIGTTWVLVQIRLPIGFTIFDLKRDGGDTPPANSALFNALDKAGCPTNWEYSGGVMNSIFNPATHKNPSCTATIEHILRDKLQVDGFFYSYTFTNFKACQDTSSPQNDTSTFRGGAFVLTNGSMFKADDVRIFNSNTVDDLQDRIDIESTFYKSDSDAPNGTPVISTADLYAQYPAYQGWTISSTYQTCTPGSPNCLPYLVSAYICPTAQIIAAAQAAVPPLPTPMCTNEIVKPSPPVAVTTISSANAPLAGSNCYVRPCANPPTLLWNDLDSKPIDPDLDSYMKTNYYSCDGKPDYL